MNIREVNIEIDNHYADELESLNFAMSYGVKMPVIERTYPTAININIYNSEPLEMIYFNCFARNKKLNLWRYNEEYLNNLLIPDNN